MKKLYIAPEMEILDAEIEGGILVNSRNGIFENGQSGQFARQYGGDFEGFDDFEDDEY